MENRIWFVCEKCGKPCRALNYLEYIAHRASLVPIETRQKVLDIMHGGKNVGDTAKELGIETEDVLGVLNDNVQHHEIEYFNKEAV